MKNLFFAFVCLLGFQSTFGQSDAKPYKIDITVAGLEDSVAYLGYHFGTKKYLLDTSQVSAGGVTHFEGEKEVKTGVYFLYSKSFYMDFVIDEDLSFEITTTSDDVYEDMVVVGSSINEEFKEVRLLMLQQQQKMTALTSSLDSLSSKSDTVRVRAEIAELNKLNKVKAFDLQTKFGDSYVGQILRMMGDSPELKIEGDELTVEQKKQQYAYYKAHFFDGLDFDSPGLMRAPNFHNKVKEYIDKVTFQNPDSIIASVDIVLGKSENNPELFRYWLINFFQDYQNSKIMGMDKVFVHLADNYYLKNKASWADSAFTAKLTKEMVFHRENQIGLIAPQIYLLDTLEARTSLYDLKSDYLVLFFYDPDCGHCKKKTPILRDLYKEMDGSFEVAAITVGTDIDKWKKFIKKFDLDWIDLGDPHYQSNFRMQYNVRSTPQIYILDKNKKIIAKKLDVEQIGGFIEDRRRIDALSQ